MNVCGTKTADILKNICRIIMEGKIWQHYI